MPPIPPCSIRSRGLVVDKGITMADLKGTLNAVIREIYGPNTKTRFRPHHFPSLSPPVRWTSSATSAAA